MRLLAPPFGLRASTIDTSGDTRRTDPRNVRPSLAAAAQPVAALIVLSK